MMVNNFSSVQATCGSVSLAENNTYFTSRFFVTAICHKSHEFTFWSEINFDPHPAAGSRLVQAAGLRSASAAPMFVSWGLISRLLLSIWWEDDRLWWSDGDDFFVVMVMIAMVMLKIDFKTFALNLVRRWLVLVLWSILVVLKWISAFRLLLSMMVMMLVINAMLWSATLVVQIVNQLWDFCIGWEYSDDVDDLCHV